MRTIILTSLLAAALAALSPVAGAEDEEQALQVLQSGASAAEKEGAFARLKRIGTAKAVPTLVSLLSDEQLAQWALDVLETMPVPAAGEALAAALRTTSGQTRAGVIAALGKRREKPALPDLVKLLADPDPMIATHAAQAVGRIGGREAIAGLRKARTEAPAPLHLPLANALLECAEQLLAAGDVKGASALYGELNAPQEPEAVRAAAFRGLVLSAEGRALSLVERALKGSDAVARVVAVQLARELKGRNATTRLAALLPKTTELTQVELLEALSQRGDPAAARAAAAATRSRSEAVRVAALTALGELGDASHVLLLAESAATGKDPEREAARTALTSLRRGEVLQALLTQVGKARTEVQVELLKAAAQRGDRRAVPVLLKIAETQSGKTAAAAVRAVEKLATATHADALLGLLLRAKTDEARDIAESAFVSVGNRSRRAETFAAAALKAMPGADVTQQCSLLRVAGQLGGALVLEALRRHVNDANREIRDTAVRALAEDAGPDALPDLLRLASAAESPSHRAFAVRGYWRLVGAAEDRPLAERLKLCQEGLAVSLDPEGKRLALVEIARLAHPDSLQLAEKLRADAAVGQQAEGAACRIAGRLINTHRTVAEATLRSLAAQAVEEGVRADARAVIASLEANADYVVPWLVSGPYREAGKECQALFDVTFPPEQAQGGQVGWQPAPPPASAAEFWRVDLSSVVGGNHCVVYLRTRVFSPKDQPVSLEIGSDDGVKLWVNGALVHANNAVRGFTPGQDRAQTTLRQGWNEFLAKITQHTMGCDASVRLRAPDGAVVAGLRFDPQGEPLVARVVSVLPKPSGFRKLRLSDQFYAEGAYTGDFNKDGRLDVVAGPFWFEGPDFQKQHEIRPPKTYDPNGYSDNFLTYTGDFNGDGWIDVLYVGFPGAQAFWYENPAGKPGPSQQHLAYQEVGNESPVWGDVTGDGRPELIFNNNGYLGYATWDPGHPDQPWTFHAVSQQDGRYQKFTHGVGFGDINGDGRVDLVEAVGWWEQPKEAKPDQPWTFHPYQFAEAAAQMLVNDVDGDGLADVITARHCHRYGLLWYKQVRDAQGRTDWQKNVILSPTPEVTAPDFRVSQLHALELVDMNGDGRKDILTGKRYWAHGPTGDVEASAPAVVCWFELQRDAQGHATFTPHVIDDDSGVGTQVAAADLNEDGRPDVIVANKKGLFVHLSQPVPAATP